MCHSLREQSRSTETIQTNKETNKKNKQYSKNVQPIVIVRPKKCIKRLALMKNVSYPFVRVSFN